ncbi:SIS domain-containing protein [Conexibacter woesei]|uniref:Phosphoheptose isomerase-like protein n=1 Tax=Conexibacter woesei (strain DSM 14684 / CCUG 47730 / CIP 108061 / JCM 11494 / NBRC 100937 / ID131577) TaxID=469383 RepID=D3F8K7_CONWI|nr:SIS domain-containing protein [Conexibacter woesei]ADB50971.1 Phosphoheptose isomerase-like protein [Conexibacter woesei DSM 14684]
MSRAPAAPDALLAARLDAGEHFFAPAACDRIARCCHRMAERFARGGRLLAFGASAADRSDVRHVAVEFVHPVIVGKRALPALGLAPHDLTLLAREHDVAIAFGAGASVAAGVRAARARGCLTIGFADVGAEWRFAPPDDDPFVAQELVETLYHVLWELVHVFFEHRGLLAGRDAGSRHDSGASSFLYPFLDEREHDLDAVLADVAASARAKSQEIGALRSQTLGDGRETLLNAAAALRRALDGGGTLLALGNGGSATDAMDAVADLREPSGTHGWPPRRALDLTADPAILTAIANDVGTEAIFARQVIAYGRAGDGMLAFSTSGGSENVISALREARGRGVATVAFVGYDGGRILAEGLADFVVVTRSEHIPRIQEAQASAWHVLRELIEA